MWHGDQLALQYAGTRAMKRDLTLTGHRTAGGVLRDGMTAVQRYYLALARDAERMASFELLQRGGYGRRKELPSGVLHPGGLTRGAGLVQVHKDAPASPGASPSPVPAPGGLKVAVPAPPRGAGSRSELQSPMAGSVSREATGLAAGPSGGAGAAPPAGSGRGQGSLPPIAAARKPLPPLPSESSGEQKLPPVAAARQPSPPRPPAVDEGELPTTAGAAGGGDTAAAPPPVAATASAKLRALEEAEARDAELRAIADRALAEAEGRVQEVAAQLVGG